MAETRELSIPPDVTQEGGTEVLRVFVVDRALSIAVQRAFDDPAMWGMLFADVARQVALVYGREAGVSEAEALDAIRDAFAAGFDLEEQAEARH
jgi:hypothetical protein